MHYLSLIFVSFILLGCTSNKNLSLAEKHVVDANETLKAFHKKSKNGDEYSDINKQLLMDLTCAHMHWAEMRLEKITIKTLSADELKSYKQVIKDTTKIRKNVYMDCSQVEVLPI